MIIETTLLAPLVFKTDAMDVTKQNDLSGFHRHLLNQMTGEEEVPDNTKPRTKSEPAVKPKVKQEPADK